MTNYLPNTSSFDVGNVLYSPTSGTTAPNTKKEGGLPPIDTIASAQQTAAKQGAQLAARPSLPISNPQLPSNEMMIIAAAFCKAYTSMNNSIITQTKDYAQLQQLDQTQTQAVLQSTTNAINKQEAAEKQAAQIESYEKQAAKVNEILGWTMFAVGIALMIGTFAAGILTGGAADAALPEEAELLGADIEMVEMTSDAGDEAADAGEAGEADAADGSADAPAQDASSNTSESTSESQDAQQMNRDLDSNNAQNEKSSSSFKTAGKFLFKMGIAAALGSPMLVKGIYGIQIAHKLDPLADAQKIVGQALDVVSRNNMYFQFLQQLLQREGGVVTEETNDATEVIDTYSSITSALRGISYGLASAA